MKLLRNATQFIIDAAETMLFWLDFNRPADMLWDWTVAEKRLVEHEAQHEISEPKTSPAARPVANCAAGETPGGSVTPPDVEPPGIQLTREELVDAAHAASYYAQRCGTCASAAKWNRLADKLYHGK